MSRLYEMAAEFAELFNRYDSLIDETDVEDKEDIETAWFDTLSGMEGEFEIKAESVAQYIKELSAKADDIKKEEKILAARRKAYENSTARMKKYLMDCMNQVNLKKVETARAKIVVKNNAPALKIDDESAFVKMLESTGHKELLKYAEPEINKTDIKKLIKNGETFEGARLESSQSVVIS